VHELKKGLASLPADQAVPDVAAEIALEQEKLDKDGGHFFRFSK